MIFAGIAFSLIVLGATAIAAYRLPWLMPRLAALAAGILAWVSQLLFTSWDDTAWRQGTSAGFLLVIVVLLAVVVRDQRRARTSG